MAPSSIFLSLGTHEAPFTRAIDLIAPLVHDGNRVVIQHGYTPARAGLSAVTWLQYMPYEDVMETMTNSDTVICHAGVGTIMTALRLGHLPVVIPRLQQYGEHVDDHQCDIAIRLAESGLVTYLRQGQPVPEINTRRTRPGDDDAIGAGERLRAAVARAIDEGPTRRSGSGLIQRALGL